MVLSVEIFGIHVCMDEVLIVLPFVGSIALALRLSAQRIRAWFDGSSRRA